MHPALLLLLLAAPGAVLGLDCYQCTHTAVSATDAVVDAALQKSMTFADNQVSCLLGADTFEENVPDVVQCDWDVLNRKVLLSVNAGELKVDEDKTPLEVAYPGNRDEEYEFRCEKQRIDITWQFATFDITVDVHTRGCQAVHIADRVPNSCTFDMDSWIGDKYRRVEEETNNQYELKGELCFCESGHCNGAPGEGVGRQMVAVVVAVVFRRVFF